MILLNRNVFLGLVVAGFVVSMSACVNAKLVTYFNDLVDSTGIFDSHIPEAVIQKDDVLSISVSSVSDEAAAVFNMPNLPASPNVTLNNSLGQAVGYLVNQNGTIKFPMLGSIKVEGMTKRSLEDTITRLLVQRNLLFDPIVNVRFLNFRVTVLGEVNNPGVITTFSETMSILEALGRAGDLTIYGKRDNVILIRQEQDGQRIVHRLNLNNAAILKSPFYFLKSNDVIYVEPGKVKASAATRGQQLLPSILSGVSIIVVVISALIRS